MEESIQRILNDDTQTHINFRGTDVSTLLQQISGNKKFHHIFIEEQNQHIGLVSYSKVKSGNPSIPAKTDTVEELKDSIQGFQTSIVKKIFELFKKTKEGNKDEKEIQCDIIAENQSKFYIHFNIDSCK